jgi:TPR repeat protein
LFAVFLLSGIASAQNVGDIVHRLPILSWSSSDSKPTPVQLNDDEKRSVQQLNRVFHAVEHRAHKQPGYAALIIGEALTHGIGVPENVPAALRWLWLSLAAQQGVSEADYQIGRIYEVGNGVAPNLAMAVRYYRKAADHLNTSAQLRLGAIFQQGLGVAADMKEAQHWYEEAANRGNAKAAELLGDLLQRPVATMRRPCAGTVPHPVSGTRPLKSS